METWGRTGPPPDLRAGVRKAQLQRKTKAGGWARKSGWWAYNSPREHKVSHRQPCRRTQA